MSDIKRSSSNEWLDRTLYTRLDDKREDVIILIMQRLHLEDMAGHDAPLLIHGKLFSKKEIFSRQSAPAACEEKRK